MDFQGSLSSLGGTQGNGGPNSDSAASLLISGKLSPKTFLPILGSVPNAPNLSILRSDYDLARAENAAMIHWLTGADLRDARFLTGEFIHSAIIQDAFDVIMFDNPPRLTTAAVQALTASKYLLIPTVLDALSVHAVQKFLEQVEINSRLWPALRLAGVVGTMTGNDLGANATDPWDASRLKGAEPDAVIQLKALLEAGERGSIENRSVT